MMNKGMNIRIDKLKRQRVQYLFAKKVAEVEEENKMNGIRQSP